MAIWRPALASVEPCQNLHLVRNAALRHGAGCSGAQWEQWGNPNDPEYYDYMKSYSPIDNIRRAAYPNILLTGGAPHFNAHRAERAAEVPQHLALPT